MFHYNARGLLNKCQLNKTSYIIRIKRLNFKKIKESGYDALRSEEMEFFFKKETSFQK